MRVAGKRYDAWISMLVVANVISEYDKVGMVFCDVALYRRFEDRRISRLMIFANRYARNSAFHRQTPSVLIRKCCAASLWGSQLAR